MTSNQTTSNLRLVFLAFAAVLVLLPLGILEPGLPLSTRDAETTYVLMASSLAVGGDLRLDRGDLVDLSNAFPYQTARFRVLDDSLDEPAADDQRSGEDLLGAAYAEPVLYPLLAAPWVSILGERGPMVLNTLAFVLLVWLGVRRLLDRDTEPGMALLFALGFFGLSAAGAYVFWNRHETVGMLLVFIAFSLGWHERGGWLRGLGAGAALGAAATTQPLVAILAVPLLAFPLERRFFGSAGSMVAGLLLAAGLVLGVGHQLTGSFVPLVEDSTWIEVDAPMSPIEASPDQGFEPPRGASMLRRLGDLLWGRHGGLLPYFPFLIVALFFIRPERPAEMLLAATLLGAVLEMAAVGPPADLSATPADRRLLLFYPVVLMLANRPRSLPVLGGWAAGTALLGPLLIMPLGMLVPDGSTQAHVRNPPLAWLPLEIERLGSLDDYRSIRLPDEAGTLYARRDRVTYEHHELFPIGAGTFTFWLERDEPMDESVRLTVLSPAPENTVQIAFAGKHESFDSERPNQRFQMRFEPAEPTLVLGDRHFYRLRLSSERAGIGAWWPGKHGTRYTGAALAWLGNDQVLERDLYQVEWLACGVPVEVETEEGFRAAVRLRNASSHAWPLDGAARVRLAHRWLSLDGDVADPGSRGDFEEDGELALDELTAGETWAGWQRMQAPAKPGAYLVEIDLVWEQVKWFGEQGAATCRRPVTVIPAPVDDPVVDETATDG